LRLAIAKGHQGAQVVTQITRNSLMDGSVSVYLRVLDVWGGRMFNLVTQTRRQAWPELDAYVQAIELLPSRFDEVTP
jgi:hypothetical protein